MKSKHIYGYLINPDYAVKRRAKVEPILKSLGLKEIIRVAYNGFEPNRCNTMSKAHLKALEVAIHNDHFPLILFEDDCMLMRDFPKEIDINPNADLIYLGGSNYWNPELPALEVTEYNENYNRVKFMLSAHAILIPDANGANVIWEAYSKAIERGKFNDIHLALSSEKYLFLTPKEGFYFFQDGYNEGVTRVKI